MINLLPPETKLEISYARRNAKLIRWVTALSLVCFGIIAMSLFGMFYINKNITNQKKVLALSQQKLSGEELNSTTKKLQDLSDNVKTIVQILSKQLLFSKMLTAIGSILPAGTVLNDITISTTNAALDISVGAVDRAAATQAFVNISDPKNNFFDKADLISITCDAAGGKKYPCSATIRVTLKNNSSFYFLNTINSQGSKQ